MRFLEQETNEFDVGVKIEHEHVPTLKKIQDFYESYKTFPDIELVASWIAMDHINEHPRYYNDISGLPEMERQLTKEEKNG